MATATPATKTTSAFGNVDGAKGRSMSEDEIRLCAIANGSGRDARPAMVYSFGWKPNEN